jgi:catechol 2,3-dioxygenase-like lactoylglutathione lyase family enzyme
LTYVELYDTLADIETYIETGAIMSRVQLALNVSNIDEAVTFYTKLFGVEPAKRQPGYANFAIAEPPLKLVLIESVDEHGEGPAGALNHLGIEVESTDAVQAATRQLAGAGLATLEQEGATCCYAVQDKVWVTDPDGAPWEVYTVVADASPATGIQGDGTCCTPEGECVPADLSIPTLPVVSASGCC